jgi:hypothetical protein
VGRDHFGEKFWSKDVEDRQQFVIIFVDEVEEDGVCMAF